MEPEDSLTYSQEITSPDESSPHPPTPFINVNIIVLSKPTYFERSLPFRLPSKNFVCISHKYRLRVNIKVQYQIPQKFIESGWFDSIDMNVNNRNKLRFIKICEMMEDFKLNANDKCHNFLKQLLFWTLPTALGFS